MPCAAPNFWQIQSAKSRRSQPLQCRYSHLCKKDRALFRPIHCHNKSLQRKQLRIDYSAKNRGFGPTPISHCGEKNLHRGSTLKKCGTVRGCLQPHPWVCKYLGPMQLQHLCHHLSRRRKGQFRDPQSPIFARTCPCGNKSDE